MRLLLQKPVERGNSLLELALLMPVLGLFLGGLFEFSMATNHSMALESAAKAAVQYAIYNTEDSSGIAAAARQAGNLEGRDVSISSSKYCKCSGGSTISCSSPCTTGETKQTYVSVTVDENYTPVLDFPGFDAPETLSGLAVMRVN